MKEIAAALSKAQAAMKPAVKDSTNPHFKSKYADLTSIWDACRDALTKNGLSVSQTTDFDDENTWIKTILLHVSGEWIEGRYPLRPTQNTPQGMGSALSYARRYALAAMVGVVTDDDDGNAASERPAQKTTEDTISPEDKARTWGRVDALKEIRALKDERDTLNWIADNVKRIKYLDSVDPDVAAGVDHAVKVKRESFNVLAAG